jgi:hypothetical protein
MDLSVKRMKTSDGNKYGQHRSQLAMPQLIKKEIMDGETDRMSEKSDDSSDSGRLQMDISSQEDTEEFRNLPVLKPIGRDTPESNLSDEHGFDSAEHLWQALAQHSQSKFYFVCS